jgi:hypothetical protein
VFAITATRTAFNPKATEGILSINGIRQCVTLEPTYREVIGQPVASWKIAGTTAIPAGTYDVTIDYSPKFGRMMPLINGIQDFEDVRIHPGNSDVDTEGCILLGTEIVNGDFIGESQLAFNYFFTDLQNAIASGESPTITIQGTPPQAAEGDSQ